MTVATSEGETLLAPRIAATISSGVTRAPLLAKGTSEASAMIYQRFIITGVLCGRVWNPTLSGKDALSGIA